MKKHLMGFMLVLIVFTGLFSRTVSAVAAAAGAGKEGASAGPSADSASM